MGNKGQKLFFCFHLVFWLIGSSLTTASSPALSARRQAQRPNILFAIADDWSYGHASAYGSKFVRTPAFDRVARDGVLFTRAFTLSAKCAPSRAILLTGRNSWQLEEAANHVPYFPAKFKTWVEALGESGYFTGMTAKGWGPGVANDIEGKPRWMAGRPFNQRKLQSPAAGTRQGLSLRSIPVRQPGTAEFLRTLYARRKAKHELGERVGL